MTKGQRALAHARILPKLKDEDEKPDEKLFNNFLVQDI